MEKGHIGRADHEESFCGGCGAGPVHRAFAGCGEKSSGERIDGGLADSLPIDLEFSSGVGAWGTGLTLAADGSFSGEYHDSDMGDSGDDYPDGTVYLCNFSGKFTEIKQLDDHSYSLTLEELSSDYEQGKEWVEDGVRYVSSEPYGVEQGKDFILYLPDTPTDGLNEEFLSWWPGQYQEGQSDTLDFYGLYNVDMGYGFFG